MTWAERVESAARRRPLILLSTIAFAIVFLRRPGHVLKPEGWAESVSQNLPSLAEHGFAGVFMPVNALGGLRNDNRVESAGS